MKKITSLILAMAMVFSLSAQVFALNDDMQDNENSEANMIVITSKRKSSDNKSYARFSCFLASFSLNTNVNYYLIRNYIFRTYNITLEHWTYPPDFRS